MAADLPAPRSASTISSRRWFWGLLTICVATLVLAGAALGLVLTRTPAGPTSVYSGTFIVGTVGPCGEIIGWVGYCDMINVSLPGGHASDRLVLLQATLNQSCPSGCSVEFGSTPRNTSSFQGFDTGSFNRSATAGGVVWGGPDWMQVLEDGFCGTSKPPCPTVEVSIQIDDYGPIPTD